jgi:hypothetical protein
LLPSSGRSHWCSSSCPDLSFLVVRIDCVNQCMLALIHLQLLFVINLSSNAWVLFDLFYHLLTNLQNCFQSDLCSLIIPVYLSQLFLLHIAKRLKELLLLSTRFSRSRSSTKGVPISTYEILIFWP